MQGTASTDEAMEIQAALAEEGAGVNEVLESFFLDQTTRSADLYRLIGLAHSRFWGKEAQIDAAVGDDKLLIACAVLFEEFAVEFGDADDELSAFDFVRKRHALSEQVGGVAGEAE